MQLEEVACGIISKQQGPKAVMTLEEYEELQPEEEEVQKEGEKGWN